jgi:hypothetical protein
LALGETEMHKKPDIWKDGKLKMLSRAVGMVQQNMDWRFM